MTWNILVSAPYIQPVINDYKSLFAPLGPNINFIVPPVNERLSEGELLQYMVEVDGVICGDDEFSERVLTSSPKLKVISKWGTGIDSINREAARAMGITVCNTPDAFTYPVADTVLGYILCFARGLISMNQEVHLGAWNKTAGFALREATLGIIGVGNVGKAIAQRAKSFGMNIVGFDVVDLPKSVADNVGINMVSKEKLLSISDFVSLNCDLNTSSYHLIGKSELAIMKSTSYLINTARGPLVDEYALVEALKSCSIAGAALDVFEIEPLPFESGLRGLGNCLLAPHNANSSPEAYLRVHENTIQNLINVLIN